MTMKQRYLYCLWIGLCLHSLTLQAEKPLLPYPTDTVDGQIYYLYTVERSIGLYRISVNFDVTQEAILKANPHLQQQGLQYGEVIRIPTNQTVALPIEIQATQSQKMRAVAQSTPQQSSKEPHAKTKGRRRRSMVLFDDQSTVAFERKRRTPILKDTFALQKLDSLPNDSIVQDSLRLNDSTMIRLSVLLPLHADAIKRDKNIERFYDFYAGALLAIYEYQAQGKRLAIYTYDIGKTAQRTSEIIANHPEIRMSDAIIGPAYAPQVNTLIDSLAHDSIWCLIPFLSRIENIESNPFIIKFNPSEKIEADTIARYLAQRQDSIHCVLVEPKEGETIPSGIATLHQALKQHQVATSSITLKALLTDSVDAAFDTDKENIIIFNTERFANLQTVMPHLLNACGRYRITLFSHYSWQNEKIILPQLYTSVFAPMPIVPVRYEQLFKQYFAHELSSDQPRYDLLGYDLTSHLLHMLGQSAQDSIIIHDALYEGIQANIQYRPTATHGGYENHTVHIIHQ